MKLFQPPLYLLCSPVSLTIYTFLNWYLTSILPRPPWRSHCMRWNFRIIKRQETLGTFELSTLQERKKNNEKKNLIHLINFIFLVRHLHLREGFLCPFLMLTNTDSKMLYTEKKKQLRLYRVNKMLSLDLFCDMQYVSRIISFSRKSWHFLVVFCLI